MPKASNEFVAKLAADLEVAEYNQAKFEMLEADAERDKTTDWLVRKMRQRYTGDADNKRQLLLALLETEKDHDT